MISEDEFINKSRALFKLVKGALSEPTTKEPEDKPLDNVVVTLTPEALLTILICVGAAENEQVQKAQNSFTTNVKPASTVSLFPTLRQYAREAGIIKW